MLNYKINPNFNINCGFVVTGVAVCDAIVQTNAILGDLPANLYKSIDYKTTSAMIGSIFCDRLADVVGAIVNPIPESVTIPPAPSTAPINIPRCLPTAPPIDANDAQSQ